MPPPHAAHHAGFTWIELVLVLAVLAILGALAIPGMQETALKKQVREGLALADLAKRGVEAAWNATGEMPDDNEAAAIPASDKIVGTLVRDVAVAGGAITLTFGNNASKALEGLRVSLRPATVPGEPMVPVAWVCHAVAVPAGMQPHGRDQTDIPAKWLPVECRGPAAP
ncbi:MAG TPA: pilin [Myxococcota bacterium]|nr:pilin [Myxococcota bacterium]